jgi:hypothetical protein
MLAHFEQSAEHMLPVWSHHANENWCMIGYHSVSVIADAVLHGAVPPAQAERALAACVDYRPPALVRRPGLLPR